MDTEYFWRARIGNYCWFVCVSACIGAILGKQAASVFVTDTKIKRVSAVIWGVSGVIVAITLAYIFLSSH